MNKEHLDFAGLLILSGMVALAFILVAWPRRRAKGALTLIIFMGFAQFWAWTYAMHWLFPTFPAPFFWLNMTYFGVVGLPVVFFIYALQINDLNHWINRRTLIFLSVEPILTLIFLWTDRYHHLFFGDQRFVNASAIYSGGPWFWINVVYSYTLVLASIVLIVRGLMRSQGVFRKQLTVILAGSLVLPATNLMGLAGIDFFPGMDLTPVLFTIQGVFLIVGLFKFSIFELVPIAQETLIETMPEGMLVFDARNRLVEINHSALNLMGLNKLTAIGQPIEWILHAWPNLEQSLSHQCAEDGHCKVEYGRHTMDVNLTPLLDKKGRETGQLITWREITQVLKAEKDLEAANLKLRDQLAQIQSLQQVLQEQAIHDSLTGMFNRRFLEDYLVKEIARADRKKYLVSFIMVDLDGFKERNDTFGHNFGDLLLKEISRFLNDHTRKEDMVVRYGGDEFLIVMSDTSLEESLGRANILREKIAAAHFHIGATDAKITASFGVAVYPSGSTDVKEVIQLADQALYRAKNSGRNQVVGWDCADDLTGEGPHPFTQSQLVTLDSGKQTGFTQAGGKIRGQVEGVQVEEVAVRFSGRRTGAAVAVLAKAVASLAAYAGHLGTLGHVTGQAIQHGRQVVEHPMGKGTGGGVRVIQDQGEALRPGRHLLPVQAGREVLAAAGVFDRDGAAVGESGRRQVHINLLCRKLVDSQKG